MAASLKGKVDGIGLIGSLSTDGELVAELKNYVGYIKNPVPLGIDPSSALMEIAVTHKEN